ncbi:primary-amine oxidase [soil metagenome]
MTDHCSTHGSHAAPTTRISRAQAIHDPLDPLDSAEIQAVRDALKAGPAAADTFRFVTIGLREPLKTDLSPTRQSHVVLLDRADGATYEAVVGVADGALESWRHIPGVQAAIMLDEFEETERIVKAHPEFAAALALRGVPDLDLVCVEPWSAGYYGDEDHGRRIVRGLIYVRDSPGGNPYAHPVDRLAVVVDLNSGEVVSIEDDGIVSVPSLPDEYAGKDTEGRAAPAPLEIHQPEGAGFSIDGNTLAWERWRLHIGFTQREGIVLNKVAYLDGDELRSVLYRGSLAEMVVPYGDPSPVQYRKNAFDAGEYNIGALANRLQLGCDCLGEITYLDAVVNDSHGNPLTLENAICIHEEDAGLLWKHTDMRTGIPESRRSRRLVISMIATVSNYEYGFYWNLYQDGTIEFQVKATGIVSTAALAEGDTARYGQLLNTDGLYAPIHQHIFNVRLDLDIDGSANTFYEVQTEAPGDAEDPNGTAFYTTERPLVAESDAVRDSDPAHQRFWRIVNHDRRNIVGEPTAYQLHPAHPLTLFARSHSHVAQRAGFAQHSLWVTAFDRDELYAAGDYPNQSRGGDGLPAYVARDRPLVNEDLVVWYTFGAHHVVRLEDWPVMPVQTYGFMLQPSGFFDRNPTLGLPPERG